MRAYSVRRISNVRRGAAHDEEPELLGHQEVRDLRGESTVVVVVVLVLDRVLRIGGRVVRRRVVGGDDARHALRSTAALGTCGGPSGGIGLRRRRGRK